MLRYAAIALVAAAGLAGCVTTAPYGYRGEGGGDYYYGRPSVEYRHPGHYDGYYGSPYYGGPYHGPYRPGFYGSIRYGWPSRGYWGYPYWGNRYYGNPYWGGYPRPIYRPRPDQPGEARPRIRPDGGTWREMIDSQRPRAPQGPRVESRPEVQPARPAQQRDGGGRWGEMIQRQREGGIRPSSEQDQ